MSASLLQLTAGMIATYDQYYMGLDTRTNGFPTSGPAEVTVTGAAALQDAVESASAGGAFVSASIGDGALHAYAKVEELAPSANDPYAYNAGTCMFNGSFSDSFTVTSDMTVTFTPIFNGSVGGNAGAQYIFRLGDYTNTAFDLIDQNGSYGVYGASVPPPTTVTLLANHIYQTLISLDIGAQGLNGASGGAIVDNQGIADFSDTATFVATELDSQDDPVAGNPDLLFVSGNHYSGVACYAAGTRIATPRGDIPIEHLAPGDRITALFGGAVEVIWVGRRHIDCHRHPRPSEVWPIRVLAGAFAAGQPCRDLFLSPDHAVYVGAVLVPIRHLTNGGSIAPYPMDSVTYFHVELPAHDVVLAENLPAESFLATGNRANFTNGSHAVALHPDFASLLWEAKACAPLIVTGPALAAVRRLVNARVAEAMAQRGARGTQAA